jgi:predicted dehydrogenase
MKKLKVAIVGTGNVARQNYIPYLAGRGDIEMGFHNRTMEKVEEILREHPGTLLETPDAVAAWNPDCALVLTSETARYETAMTLVGAGIRRLFFEKPLVAARGQAHVLEEDFEKGREVLAAAGKKGIETAMIFNYRFFEQTLAAGRIARERNFGEAIHVSGLVHYACWSHCIDLVHLFAGDWEEVTALGGGVARSGQGIEAADTVVSFRATNGATGTLIGTSGLKWQHPLYELTVVFENGRLHLRDIDGALEILDGAQSLTETRTLGRDGSRWTQYDASFGKSLAAYLDSVRAGKEPPVPGLAGLRELQSEAAMRRSIARKRPVRVQEEFPLFES